MRKKVSICFFASVLLTIGFAGSAFSKTPGTAAGIDDAVASSKNASVFQVRMEDDQNGFFKRLTVQGVVFSVSAPGNGQLQVVAETGGEPIVMEQWIEGKVTDAEAEDLDGNGLPEVLVYLSSGSQNYGKVIGYSMYSRSTMGQIYFPGIQNDPSVNRGYMGGDEFEIVETTLVQRFPVYQNGRPTGQMRQVQWKLGQGENSPAFRIDRTSEYGGAPAGQTGNYNQGNNQQNFSQNLSLEGVTFDVNAPGNGSLTIRAYGLQGDDDVAEHRIDGKSITGAEVGDLNGDGSPEVYVYLSSGNQARGEVIAYSVLGRSSIVQIYFPGIQNNQAANGGYMGQDEFRVVENRLVQRFPVYQYGRATGKTRQVQWMLVSGENAPAFRVDRVAEY